MREDSGGKAVRRAPRSMPRTETSFTHKPLSNAVETDLATSAYAVRDAHLAALADRKARLLSLPAEVRES